MHACETVLLYLSSSTSSMVDICGHTHMLSSCLNRPRITFFQNQTSPMKLQIDNDNICTICSDDIRTMKPQIDNADIHTIRNDNI